MTGGAVLSLRTLNRTVLDRQLLLARTGSTPLEVVEHLVAMQSQEPNWPYVGLWTRIAGFRHDELTALLSDRSVVRGSLLRNTQHLASANDFRWLRPTVQPALDRALRGQYFTAHTTGLDLAELVVFGRKLLARKTLTRPQLGRLLAGRYPGRDGGVLATAMQILLPLVHPYPNACWGKWGTRASTPVTLARAWIGQPMATVPRVEKMIMRYLTAFGPAGVMDIQAWSGLTRLREVLDGLRSRLVVYRDEQGRELFDVPAGSIRDPDLPAPVRFLPAFDNLLVGHADRTRVIADEHRGQVMPGQAMVRPTFLVDGFVRGTWSVTGSTLSVSPFRRLSKANTAEVTREAERMLVFVADECDARNLVLG